MVIEILEQVPKKKRTWNLAPVLQIVSKILKIINFGYIYQLTKFGDFMSCGSKDVFKNVPCLMYYTHRDVTDSVNHGIMFKNTKT